MVSGTGIKNKLLEAMASGLPCVATPLALQGIDVEPGRELLVGADEEELAAHIVRLLDDKALAEWLRKNPVDTLMGRLRFDGPNNYGDDLSKLKQSQDGKWVVVWPTEFAAPGARLLPP